MLSAALVAMLSLAGPAEACRSPDSEDHIFLAYRPARLPDGLQLLKVQVDRPDRIEDGFPEFVPVIVLEGGPEFRRGEKLQVKVNLGSSCTRWGVVAGTAFVVGRIRRGGGKPGFEAASFRPAMIGAIPRTKHD